MNAFLTGNELKEALAILPQYDDRIRNATTGERLLALNNLFNLYYPSPMAAEIYSKLYLAYVRAMQKKHTLAAVRQGYENRKAAKGQHYQGIIGGSDSFTIVGVSGIGKSSAISRAISLITKDQFTQPESPEIISFLTVQTPGDSSLKGLLLEILRSIDAILNTKFYADAIRSRATVDMLIGLVSQVCLNHLCVLIVDEAQNLVAAKNGKTLVNTLVQLINNSGISLCFVGTPECTAFFESAYQLARRSIGLSYSGRYMDRPEWTKLRKKLQPGDTIVFDEVSRMSRNANEGADTYQELFESGIALHFLKEPHIDTATYRKALASLISMTGTNVDFILEGINKYLMALAKEQIRLAFGQAEKEVEFLRRRTAEGLRQAKANGSQIGAKAGSTFVTRKSVAAKELIAKHAKAFGGSLDDGEVMRLCGCSRNTYYKYKREIACA